MVMSLHNVLPRLHRNSGYYLEVVGKRFIIRIVRAVHVLRTAVMLRTHL